MRLEYLFTVVNAVFFSPKDQTVALWVGRSNFVNLKKSFNQPERHFPKCSIMITQFLTSFWREWASLYLISPHCVPGQLYIKELILFQRFCSLICILITVTFWHHLNGRRRLSFRYRGVTSTSEDSSVMKWLLLLTLLHLHHYPRAGVIWSPQ